MRNNECQENANYGLIGWTPKLGLSSGDGLLDRRRLLTVGLGLNFFFSIKIFICPRETFENVSSQELNWNS